MQDNGSDILLLFSRMYCILGAYAFKFKKFTLLTEQLGGFVQPFPVFES